jgi:hypothetical protein
MPRRTRDMQQEQQQEPGQEQDDLRPSHITVFGAYQILAVDDDMINLQVMMTNLP